MNTKQLSWLLPVVVIVVVAGALVWVLLSGPRDAAPVATAAERQPRPGPVERIEKVRPAGAAPGQLLREDAPAAAPPAPEVTPIPTLPPEAVKRPVRISGEIVLVDRANIPPERRHEFPPVPPNVQRPDDFLLASVTLLDPATRLSTRSDSNGRFTLETEALDTATSVKVLVDGYYLHPLNDRKIYDVAIPPSGDATLRLEMVNRPGFHMLMPDGREVTDEMMAKDPEVRKWVDERVTAFQFEIGVPQGTPDRLGVGPQGGFGKATRSLQVREGDAPVEIQIRGFVMPDETGS